MDQKTGELFADFLNHLRAKDASALTICNYTANNKAFFDFAKVPATEVKRTHANAYLAHLRRPGAGRNGQNLMSRTIKTRFSCVSSFFKYLDEECQLLRNPIRGMALPKGPGRPKVVMTKEEARAMLDLPCETRQDRMDRLCLEIMYSTGARRGDLVTAKLADLNMAESSLFVIGKGKKPANLILTDRCKAVLQAYLDSDRPKDAKSDKLLTTEKGKDYLVGRVYDGVLRSAKRAGITKKVHPHAWRRTIATHFMQANAPMKSIQVFLRHNNMATTDIYLSADEHQVKTDHKKFHPLK